MKCLECHGSGFIGASGPVWGAAAAAAAAAGLEFGIS